MQFIRIDVTKERITRNPSRSEKGIVILKALFSLVNDNILKFKYNKTDTIEP